MCDDAASKCDKEEFCPVCNSVANKRCAACSSVFYCSKEHQKSDWKSHSKKCCPSKLVESALHGQHNVATRSINIDEIVMAETPLLITPSPLSGPSCLHCYTTILDYGKNCKKCGWSLCRNCTTHGSECQITMKYRESPINIEDYSTPVLFHATVTVLRAVALRDKNPNEYRKLLSLPNAHRGDNMENDWTAMTIDDLALLIKECMRLDDVDEMEIVKILEIARTNARSIDCRRDNIIYTVILHKMCYNLHDCRPNCAIIFSGGNESRFVIQAATKIAKGEPILVSYVNTLESTVNRRYFLKKFKSFDCTCERCKDPTEFGTMFNAMRCRKDDCTGYMLPPTFIVSKDEPIPDYVCNKCNFKTDYASIAGAEKMTWIYYFSMHMLCLMPINKLDELKRSISIFTEELHENHLIILNMKLEFVRICIDYVQLTVAARGTLIVNILNDNIIFCQELDSIFEILMPAQTTIRGIILFSMFLSKMEISKIRPTPKDFQKFIVKGCMDILNRAHRLLRHEAKNGIAEKVAIAVMQNKAFMKAYKKMP